MILFIIFLIIPLIEISLFITVGDEIGLMNTLLLCVLTAFIGGALIRWQGLQTLFKARAALNHGEMPLAEFFDGICLAVAGALLMTPGFFTDGIGFALTVPPFRDWLRHALAKHFNMQGGAATGGGFGKQPYEPDVIEAEYELIDDEDKP